MTGVFMVHKTAERLVAPMIATKSETSSKLRVRWAGTPEGTQPVRRGPRHCSIQKRAFLFGLLKWSALVLLSFAISGCESSALHLIALTLVPSTVAPRFNAQTTLVPTLAEGTAVIGSTVRCRAGVTGSGI